MQKDLVDAFKTEASGIRCAASDVTDPEALAPDNPPWTAKKYSTSPYVSSRDSQYVARELEISNQNLRRHLVEWFTNEVDTSKG